MFVYPVVDGDASVAGGLRGATRLRCPTTRWSYRRTRSREATRGMGRAVDRHRSALARAARALVVAPRVASCVLGALLPVPAFFADPRRPASDRGASSRPGEIDDVLGGHPITPRHDLVHAIGRPPPRPRSPWTIGLPVAYTLSRFAFRGRAGLPAGTRPGSVRAAHGRGGNRLRPFPERSLGAGSSRRTSSSTWPSWFGVVGGAWEHVDPSLEDPAAEGSAPERRPARIKTSVLVPLARPAIEPAPRRSCSCSRSRPSGSCCSWAARAAPRSRWKSSDIRRSCWIFATAAVLALLQLVVVTVYLLWITAPVAESRAVRQGRFVASEMSARAPRTVGERLYIVGGPRDSHRVHHAAAARTSRVALAHRSAGPDPAALPRLLGSVREGSALGGLGPRRRRKLTFFTFAAGATVLALIAGLPAAFAVARARRARWLRVSGRPSRSACRRSRWASGSWWRSTATPLDLSGHPRGWCRSRRRWSRSRSS